MGNMGSDAGGGSGAAGAYLERLVAVERRLKYQHALLMLRGRPLMRFPLSWALHRYYRLEQWTKVAGGLTIIEE